MRMFIGIQLCVAATCLLLPALFAGLRETDLQSGGIQVVFSSAAFLLAVLFGMEFAVATSIRGGAGASTASDMYGLDLAGSASGALMTCIYAIPQLGVTRLTMVLGLVSAGAATFCVIVMGRER